MLGIYIKNKYSDDLKRVTEFGNLLFDELRARNIKPNEELYKTLIEANSFCENNSKALDLVISKKKRSMGFFFLI